MITPLQEDCESLDLQCKDYALLERLNKHSGYDAYTAMMFAAGWEAAMTYYREVLIRGAQTKE